MKIFVILNVQYLPTETKNDKIRSEIFEVYPQFPVPQPPSFEGREVATFYPQVNPLILFTVLALYDFFVP